MGIVKVAGFAVSLDGFGAGTDQSLQHPLGMRGATLHQWIYKTSVFKTMFRQVGGSTGVDNDFAENAMKNVGAWILGRNMFGPVRGDWGDGSWKGWWGDNPPYHCDVFVLTHHPRAPIHMNGGTVFHFVTDGIEPALRLAKESAKGKDIRIGGGVSTVRQYLKAGLIDQLHLVQSPVFLGAGENLLTGIDMNALGFEQIDWIAGEDATHITIRKK